MANATLRAAASPLKAPGRVTGHVKLMKGKRGPVWYLRYRYPSGRQVQKRLGPAWTERSRPPAGYFTKKGAEDELRALLTDIKRGEVPDPGDRSGKTFADAVAEWLRYVEIEKARRPSTVRGYRNVARILEDEFGSEAPLEQITTETIDGYRRRMLTEGKVSRRTAQQRLVLLHGLLRRAVSNRWIPVNPADSVERINLEPRDEFNVLSVEQVEAVARAAENEMFGAAVLVAAYTGLRTGELRALRWRDVDFTAANVHVRRNKPVGGDEGAPKSGKGRSVPLIDQAAAALDLLSRRDDFLEPDDRVFPNEVGDPLADDALRDAFYAAMEAAGLDRESFPAGPFRFHDLRHTFGTLAVQVFALVDVQAYMGHAHIATTMRYAHHVPKVDAARRFSEAIEGARTGESLSPSLSRTPAVRA